MFTLDKLGFTIYSETCVNRTLNNSDSSINLNLDKVPMHKLFVNLTCINRTPVYSKNKSWFLGDYIQTGLTVQVMIITSDRVRNVTFGTSHQQSRLWNLQPDNIRESPSIQALKYSLKSNISSKPFYYYTGSRLGQILHSRLRMQCSSLNQHLYRKNIVDSPNCVCGLTESTTHYLFHYPR